MHPSNRIYIIKDRTSTRNFIKFFLYPKNYQYFRYIGYTKYQVRTQFYFVMGLEQFKTLFFFIKVLGVLPHVITLNERTLRFNQFCCGWRSPATWWFVLIFGGHIMWIFITSGDAFKNISHSNDSTMIIIVRMIWHISYTLVKFIPVLLLFYVWRLKSVFKVFRKVDHALKHASVHLKTCTTKERTIFGIIIGVLIVNFINL